jgi:MFS family permease
MGRHCGREFIYSVILSLGSMTVGYVIAFTSPARAKLEEEFPSVSKDSHTWYNAIAALTGIAGPFIVKAFLSLGFGRRITTFAIAVTGIGFWLLLLATTADHFWVGIFARGLLGLTMSSFSAICPMYIVELVPTDLSGFFGTFPQIFTAFGVFFVNLLGTWLTWRELVIVGSVVCIALSLFVWFVPESPASEEDHTGQTSEGACSPQWIGSTFAGCLFLVFQQLSGINAILTNQAELFGDVGMDKHIASAVSSSAQVIACLFSGPSIQLLGRKVVWIISLALIVATDAFFGVTQKPSIKDAKTFPPIVPVIIVFLNLLGFGLGAGPIPWFIVPEMFAKNASVRATAVSLATCTNWVFSFIVIIGFPYLSDWMGLWATFFIFAGVSAVGIVFGVLAVKDPENVQQPTKSDYDLVSN